MKKAAASTEKRSKKMTDFRIGSSENISSLLTGQSSIEDFNSKHK